jgi:hypothetical protein
MTKLLGAKLRCESAKISFESTTSSDAKENIKMFALMALIYVDVLSSEGQDRRWVYVIRDDISEKEF